MKRQGKIATIITLQVLTSTVIVFGGPHPFYNPLAKILLLLCAALMLWAVLVMHLSRLRISPKPHHNSQLIETGPYRLIRHPMYLSLLVFAGIFVVWGFNGLRIIAWVVLLLDLVVKMRLEEQILCEDLSGYAQYRHRTWRLLPYIY